MAVLKLFPISSTMGNAVIERDHGIVQVRIPGAIHPITRDTLKRLLDAMPEA